MHNLLFLNPGHFHAALTLRLPHPSVAEDVYVYAEPGPDLERFLELVAAFNARAEAPTRWRVHTHSGPDYLERLIAERRGDVVVIAGATAGKMAAIARLHEAGFAVFADKPWVRNSADAAHLSAALAGPPLAMDLMITRYEIAFVLQRELARDPEVFGEFAPPADGAPAIEIESVHHLYKLVNDVPLVRPPWFFDVAAQGAGIVDVSSHLVDQAQWILGDGRPYRFGEDLRLAASRRWPTEVDRERYRQITGEAEFPPAAADDVHGDTLHLDCNGEIDFTIRGVPARVRVLWALEPPPGGGDTHDSRLQGTRAEIAIVQTAETGWRDELRIAPRAEGVREALERRVTGWQGDYPGTALQEFDDGTLQIDIPDPLRIPHEAQFALLRDRFLGYLDAGAWPADLHPEIEARYALLARVGDGPG